MRIDKRFLLLVFLISFSLGCLFAFSFDHPVVSDAVEYDMIGWNLARGNGFSSLASPPFNPTMNREPVYPVFLGILYKIFGHNYIPVYFFQVVIFSLTCILVYLLAREIFTEKVAKYSSVFTALCPTLANYPSYILTETIFIFLLCVLVYVLTKAIKSQKLAWFFASGAFLGIAALCKVMVSLFFIPVCLGVFLFKRDWKHLFGKTVMQLAVCGLVFLMVISPWCYRNQRLFGSAQMSLRGGAALWESALRLDESLATMKQRMVFNFSEYLGNRMFPGAVERPRDFVLMRSKRAYAYRNQLLREGFDLVQIDTIMRKEALEKIRDYPYPFLKTLALMPIEAIQMAGFLYIPTLNESHVIGKFYELRHGKTILSAIRGVFRLLAYPVLLFAGLGMIQKKSLWRRYIFLLFVIAYINFVHVLLACIARYAVPLIPFYLIFASAGILKSNSLEKEAKDW